MSAPSPGPRSIELLRAIRDAAAAGVPMAPDVAAQVIEIVDGYEADARAHARDNSLPPPDAARRIGLVPAPGAPAWWQAEARMERDAKLRELRQHFPDLGIAAASREIARLGRRHQTTSPPAALDDKRRLIAEALAAGAPMPSERTLRRILGQTLAL